MGSTVVDATKRSPAAAQPPSPPGIASRPPRQPHAPADRDILANRFRQVRSMTGRLTAVLTPEDQMIQSMAAASPTKWHLGHTSWFLENFVLGRFLPGYTAFDDRYAFLFRAMKEPAETCHPAARRSLLSRPGHEDVARYRDHVNAAVLRLVREAPAARWAEIAPWLELALHHEEQHQEQLLADIKHAFWSNPLRPAYQPAAPAPLSAAAGQRWVGHPGGSLRIGNGPEGFAFDMERPRHAIDLPPFLLAARLVTNAEYQEFVEDGGYGTAAHWTPDGWATARAQGWKAPLYWAKHGGLWHQFTLSGLRLLDGEEPVCHVSWYEADAFARWAGLRLPAEAEWEVLAAERPLTGNLLEHGRLHPCPHGGGEDAPWQMFGDGWEWTNSPFMPYVRYRQGPLAAGEFATPRMASGRMVLRGGSALTPGDLIRATYRHHLSPDTRWQMTAIRLAADA